MSARALKVDAEARLIAEEILAHGGSEERWSRADASPELAAAVLCLVTGDPGRTTARAMREQFYRYGEMGIARGGRVWTRPSR